MLDCHDCLPLSPLRLFPRDIIIGAKFCTALKLRVVPAARYSTVHPYCATVAKGERSGTFVMQLGRHTTQTNNHALIASLGAIFLKIPAGGNFAIGLGVGVVGRPLLTLEHEMTGVGFSRA